MGVAQNAKLTDEERKARRRAKTRSMGFDVVAVEAGYAITCFNIVREDVYLLEDSAWNIAHHERKACEHAAAEQRRKDREAARRRRTQDLGWRVIQTDDGYAMIAPGQRQGEVRATDDVAWTDAHNDCCDQIKRDTERAAARRESLGIRNLSISDTLSKRAQRLRRPNDETGDEPESPKEQKKIKKKKRKEEKREKAANEPRRIYVKAPDGSRPLVEVRSKMIYDLEEQQIEAISRVTSDWESAYRSGIKSAGFDPGVDGGRIAGENTAMLAAQDRLWNLKAALGDREYAILIAFVIHDVGPASMGRQSGQSRMEISGIIKNILRKTAEFYNPTWKMDRDSLWETAERINSARGV